MARSTGLVCALAVALGSLALVQGQRITTIQLDGVQYFVSRMNPYSPELNYFLAYQYCRSLGLQLTSFESKEKSDSITQYLRNAGYNQYDFWTSGNRLGTDMFLWMSTGLPFNATFDLMNQADSPAAQQPEGAVVMTSEQPAPLLRRPGSARQSKSGPSSGCVALKAPDLRWSVDDCTGVKDFICEQTRCYYYNYGSIPVSSSQGRNNKDRPVPAAASTTTTTTTTPVPTLASTTTTEVYQAPQSPAEAPAEAAVEQDEQSAGEQGAVEDAEATGAPAAADDMVEEGQPDNSVLTGSDAATEAPLATDAPAAPARARGKFLEQPADLGWGWPANIKLEIPVPRRVSGASATR
ncbi:hypothetical protein ONE63_008875 [Megalurothrips usitatus]|uniref:C-type lectin domain-containing protein n=1 Tax=Megalurothrips usitatus TaxID=439358 RepID=A0AAV7XLW3_9NEOP|nr:hypothetical protein ONE63_008875 [Megalurothrips usitatus]